MKKKLNIILFITQFVFTINSCQTKGENTNIATSKTIDTPYFDKWQLIRKESNKYYKCIEDDKFLTVDKNKIFNHNPMEDSDFPIDHIKQKKDGVYLYSDKEESIYFIFNWIDKEKGICSWKLNNYDTDLFISEKKIKTIESKKCEKSEASCDLNKLSNNFNFKIEASDYSRENEKKYPIACWIIINNKKSNIKPQEIHFEPNSWVTYSDLPCDKFVVKDFNFDGLEDFAFVWDAGGNAGELYEYYFQDTKGNFSLTDSFPLQHGVLASEINNSDKTIISRNPVGCCNLNVNTYKLNSDGSWKTTSIQEKL